jgi:hypothetical protein
LTASKASKDISKLGMEFEQENYGDESTLVAPSDGTIFADFFEYACDFLALDGTGAADTC